MLLSLVSGDPAFNMLQPAHNRSWDIRGGMAVPEPWEEIEFTEADGATGEFIAADCLTINTGTDGFVVSEYARQILEPMLTRAGEFWRVRVLGQPYWWLNCMALIEVLDRKKTDADWSEVSGEWGSFSWISTTRRLAFRANRLRRAPPLFRIPEYPQGVLFAREALQGAVLENGLTGFRFDPVWSTEAGGVVDPVGFGFSGMFEASSAEHHETTRQTARATLAERESYLRK